MGNQAFFCMFMYMDKLSNVGNNIVGSEIIKISQHIKQVQLTKSVLNLTMGDFDPKVNPIPTMLRDYITDAYFNDLTNYPLAAGELHLRQSISSYFKHRRGIEYNNSEILVGCGVRPLIYTVFKAIINEGDTVVYPVPSWNNNHYSFLHNADLEPIECTPENAFFPTVEDIESRLYTTTRLVCLCSPQNPTGRIIDRGVLKGICEAIVNENKQRGDKERPCYLFFDQIYSDLVGDEFTHPLDVCPEIREYLICADGISKSLCATGVRVGWLMGPKDIIGKMTEVFSHIGAWAAKPEQNAVAMYLYREDINDFIQEKQQQYTYISSKIIDLFNEMKNEGYKVDCQNSDGGIYISVYLDYVNKFPTTEDYINFLIEECGLGIVPFEYFGSKENKGWFRISIGSVDPLYIDNVLTVIKNAIIKSSSHIYGYEESR